MFLLVLFFFVIVFQISKLPRGSFLLVLGHRTMSVLLHCLGGGNLNKKSFVGLVYCSHKLTGLYSLDY
jgi:hypothetical protein